MFKKTKTRETTLLEPPSNLMHGTTLKQYNDPMAWHNQFFEVVTSNLDEENFKPLFKVVNMCRGTRKVQQRGSEYFLNQLSHTQR